MFEGLSLEGYCRFSGGFKNCYRKLHIVASRNVLNKIRMLAEMSSC
jgi:hypothetical protein